MKDLDRKRKKKVPFSLKEKELALTFHAALDSIALIDRNHRIIRVNKAMAERLGKSTDDCIGLACHELMHGLPAPPPFCPHSRLLQDGSDHREEIREDHLGGTFVVSVSPLLDGEGHVQGSVHIVHDITERKQMEDRLVTLNQELQEANRELQGAYRWMRENRDNLRRRRYEESLAAIVDRNGRIEWISDDFIGYIGKTGNHFDGSLADLVAPHFRNRLVQGLKQAWMGSIDSMMVEFSFEKGGKELFELKISRLNSSAQKCLLVSLEHAYAAGNTASKSSSAPNA